MAKRPQQKFVRSSYKDGIFYIWYNDIPKKELCVLIPLDVLTSLLKRHANPNWVLFDVCHKGMLKATQDWIMNTKDEVLRHKREEKWEEWPFVSDLVVDDMVRELRKQSKKHNIDLRSWFERR